MEERTPAIFQLKEESLPDKILKTMIANPTCIPVAEEETKHMDVIIRDDRSNLVPFTSDAVTKATFHFHQH